MYNLLKLILFSKRENKIYNVEDIKEIFIIDPSYNFYEPINYFNIYLLIPRKFKFSGEILYKKILDEDNMYNVRNKNLYLKSLNPFKSLFIVMEYNYDPKEYVAIKTPLSFVSKNEENIPYKIRIELEELKEFIINLT